MKNIFVSSVIIGLCAYFSSHSLMAVNDDDFDGSPLRIAGVQRICGELNIDRDIPLSEEQEHELLLRAKRGDEDAFYVFCEGNFQGKPQLVNTTIRDLTWEGHAVAFKFYAISLNGARYSYGRNPGHVRYRIDTILDGTYTPLARYSALVEEAQRLRLEGIRTGKYGYPLGMVEELNPLGF